MSCRLHLRGCRPVTADRERWALRVFLYCSVLCALLYLSSLFNKLPHRPNFGAPPASHLLAAVVLRRVKFLFLYRHTLRDLKLLLLPVLVTVWTVCSTKRVLYLVFFSLYCDLNIDVFDVASLTARLYLNGRDAEKFLFLQSPDSVT